MAKNIVEQLISSVRAQMTALDKTLELLEQHLTAAKEIPQSDNCPYCAGELADIGLGIRQCREQDCDYRSDN